MEELEVRNTSTGTGETEGECLVDTYNTQKGRKETVEEGEEREGKKAVAACMFL